MERERNLPGAADHVGQAAGGITGVVAGATIGATAGPLGVLLGGIAGAIGGWWTGRAVAEAAADITDADDAYYRSDFERTDDKPSRFEDARHAYYLGHVAACNPEYAGRDFEDVEPELSRAWANSGAPGEWTKARGFAAVGFERGKDRRRTRPESDRRSPDLQP